MKKTLKITLLAVLVLFTSLSGLYAQTVREPTKETEPPTASKEDLRREANEIKRLLKDTDKKVTAGVEQIQREQNEVTARQLAATQKLRNELLAQQEAQRVASEKQRQTTLRQISVAGILLVLILIGLGVFWKYQNRNQPMKEIRMIAVPTPKFRFNTDKEMLEDPESVEEVKEFVEARNLHDHIFPVIRHLQDGREYICDVKARKNEPLLGRVQGDSTSNEWIAWKDLPKRAAKILAPPTPIVKSAAR